VRIANINGRAFVVSEAGGIDLEAASGGSLPSDPMATIAVLDDVRAFVESGRSEPDPAFALGAVERFGPPVPRPGQVFAVGLNYQSHGDETGLAIPGQPMVFTKFPSSITGPTSEVSLPTDTVDWEIEMVAVMGKAGRHITSDAAWGHIAGLCVGQDLSERTSQMADVPPQFSLAKSYEGFAPIGPWLTTLDDVENPADLAISCRVGDESLQSSRTRHMIFDVPTIIEFVSERCELRVGDLIFTGTPEGVGMGRKPPRYLKSGDVLVSSIEGLGELSNPLI
jgi:2,4-diketo-3-deoxy-L-fuconate hydrolase